MSVKHILILALLLFMVSCSSMNEAPAATEVAEQATSTPTNVPPTETATLEPSATATATGTATATSPPTETPLPTETVPPTPVPTETPTPYPAGPPCDHDTLRRSIANLDSLQSYTIETESGIFVSELSTIGFQQMITYSIERNEGESDLIYLSQAVPGPGQNELLEMIWANDLWYLRPNADEDWFVLGSELTEAFQETFAQAQFISPDFVGILSQAECFVTEEPLRMRTAQHYFYHGIDLSAAPSLNGADSRLLARTISDVTFEVWVIPFKEVTIPVKSVLTMEIADDELAQRVIKTQTFFDLDQPLEIELPDVEPTGFFLAVPRPDDAVIVVENALLLAFTTATPPDEMITLLEDYLLSEGWARNGTPYLEDVEGIEFEAHPFIQGEEELTFGIAQVETDGGTLTLVSIGR